MAPMGSVRQKRGRLPARVYWVRRGLVLVVALLLVFAIGKVLGGNGADTTSASQANVTSARQAPATSVTLGPVAPSRKLGARAKPPLLAPSGDCRDDEVSVLPSVPVAHAGRPITITLQLTGTQPACNFEVSPDTLVVKVTSGTDRVWSSQDCAKAIPRSKVVVRSGLPVEVPVTWNGRRSDEGCTALLDWAMPGFYHVFAAARGSAASDVQFEVTVAPARTITPTPTPRPSASPSPAAARPSATPRQQPSATVKPAATPAGEPVARPSRNASSKPTPKP